MKEVEKQYQQKPRLVFQDEHRMGLQPIARKQWCFPEQKTRRVYPRFKWLWTYGFVEPLTGENHHYLFSHLNADCFQVSLDAFCFDFQVTEEAPVLLILDQARAHVAKKIKRPKGLEFLFLPPYSPELQPAERLWPLINECIANKVVKDVDQLYDVVAKRCCWMTYEAKKIVQGLTFFNWIKTVLINDQ